MLEKTKTNAKRMGLILMAVLLAAGCWWGYGRQQQSEIPQLTTFVDSTGTIEVEEEEVPLAKPKVTTKKTTKTKKKTVKLKKKSKKTYTKKKPTKTKTTTKTTTKGDTTTTVEKKVVTKVTEKYKKNSKKKTVTTKITTTTKTTVTTKIEKGNSTVSAKDNVSNDGSHYVDNSDKTTTQSPDVSASSTESKKKSTYDISIEQSAPQADEAVLKAYKTLGFTITINSSVSYAGYFNAKNQSIILREEDDTIYHELGHFLAFIAGNVDTKDAFKAVYEAEKGKYNGANKAYVTQNSSEYFAESYRDYVLNPSGLQASRPETYASIQRALNKITDSWIQTIKTVYSPVWK